ncbi:MAG: nickel-responsive transcriptional regulator NikR [Methylomonas lenta]|nr:nickel-responsive transcriptional regulator NikR [Methylomonas lenta]
MERFTISLSDDLAADFDNWIQARGYVNRSEAVRDLLRKEIESERLEQNLATHCVASLSYVYNHHERNLSERLAHLQHHAHDLVVCTMHVHLNHDDCLETLFLRGSTQSVRGFADKVSAESGVRHSVVNLVPVSSASEPQHTHFHPMT